MSKSRMSFIIEQELYNLAGTLSAESRAVLLPRIQRLSQWGEAIVLKMAQGVDVHRDLAHIRAQIDNLVAQESIMVRERVAGVIQGVLVNIAIEISRALIGSALDKES